MPRLLVMVIIGMAMLFYCVAQAKRDVILVINSNAVSDEISRAYDESHEIIAQIDDFFKKNPKEKFWRCRIDKYSATTWSELGYRVKELKNKYEFTSDFGPEGKEYIIRRLR